MEDPPRTHDDRVAPLLSCYALATRCPVLRWAVLCLCYAVSGISYAISGTDSGCVIRVCYAMSGIRYEY
eukprot:3468763-Rhodomonas_salina.2